MWTSVTYVSPYFYLKKKGKKKIKTEFSITLEFVHNKYPLHQDPWINFILDWFVSFIL